MTDQQNEAPEVWLVTGGRLWEDRPFTSKQAAEQTVERRDDGSTVVRMVPATPLTTEGAEEGRSAALEALNRLHTVHFWTDLDATEESQVAKEEDIALIQAYLASPVMSPVEGQAVKTLTMIYDLLGIGAEARTPGTLKGNIETLAMFAEKLRAVEAEFFMVPGEPDEDDAYPDDVCLVNSWGASTEEYLNQFRSALKLIGVHPAHQVAVPEIVVVALESARASLATYGEHPIIEGRIQKALQALSAAGWEREPPAIREDGARLLGFGSANPAKDGDGLVGAKEHPFTVPVYGYRPQPISDPDEFGAAERPGALMEAAGLLKMARSRMGADDGECENATEAACWHRMVAVEEELRELVKHSTSPQSETRAGKAG